VELLWHSRSDINVSLGWDDPLSAASVAASIANYRINELTRTGAQPATSAVARLSGL
jgi:hypothetical protein